MSQPATYKKEVRAQYEALPYPHRDPEREWKGLGMTWLDRLDYLNYRFWNGKRDFNNFRVLIAGDGTGDSSVYLGEQLADTDAEIIALDLSAASQDIAKARAEIRQLSNITYVHASLLDLASLGLGSFDYIVSSGVLHHLESPEDGLSALKSVLKPDGIIGVMVYGKIGRTGIYHTQEFLRLITANTDDIEEKVDIAIAFLKQVPDTNWLKHNIKPFLGDLNVNERSGIYDLLLHSQDRAYTVSEMYDWVEDCGLHLNELVPFGKGENYGYNPQYFTKDPTLLSQFAQLDKRTAQQACELMRGDINRHFFYASLKETTDTVALDDVSAIPFHQCTSPVDRPLVKRLQDELSRHTPGDLVAFQEERYYLKCVFTKGTYTATILPLINNAHTIGDIVEQVAEQYQISDNELQRQQILSDCQQLVREWIEAGIMALRYPEGKAFPSLNDMHERTKQRWGEAPYANVI